MSTHNSSTDGADLNPPDAPFRSGRGAAIAASVTIAAATAMAWYWSAKPASASSAPLPSATAIRVETAIVARTDLPVYVDALGTVQASKTATLTARVDGQLDKVRFVEGSDVHEGELLAQIDPKPYQAQLAEAQAKKAEDQAQLENARSNLQRYVKLLPEDYASQQMLDAARAQAAQLTAQVQADEAAIQAARTQLAYTSITAPFDGRTGLRLVDEGNIVRASDTGGIVVITELQPISVIFTLPQNQLPDALAALAQDSVPATALSSDQTALDQGTVALIDNRIDPATGTVRLKATFPNEHQHLWPGQSVKVRMLTRTLRNVLTVPKDAISQGPTGRFTFVVDRDGKVDMRTVSVTREVGNIAQISGGLSEGERVVTNGQYRLRPGAVVTVTATGEHSS